MNSEYDFSLARESTTSSKSRSRISAIKGLRKQNSLTELRLRNQSRKPMPHHPVICLDKSRDLKCLQVSPLVVGKLTLEALFSSFREKYKSQCL